ncbi:histidine ammonia-lyase, partial [Thermoplasmatales archaeon ex4484_30]
MIEIDGESLRIEDVIKVARGKEEVVLAKKAMEKINKCREKVEKIIDEGKIAYGINTGVGELSNVRISLDEIEKLQQNLVRSHSCAVGEELPEEVVRAMMLLRMNSLAKGYSGVTLNLVEKLGMALNKNFHPVVPSQGSMVNFNGRKVPAMEALEEAEIGAIRYKAKEGLALINGTQMMTAIACLGIYDSLMLLKNAQIAGVMSLEALKGTDQAFREEIQNARPYEGQIKCAKNLWKLTRESDIIASHKTCPKVQDAYTLRCMPQVFGAIWDSLNYVKKILEVEINSATDNPLIFDDVLSG